MDQEVKKREFVTLLKSLNIIFTVFLVMIICSIVVLGGLMVTAMFMGEQTVDNLLQKGSVSASIQFEGLEILLNDKIVNDITYDKMTVVKMLAFTLIYSALIMMIVIFVKNFLKTISKGEIFSLGNSKRIEWIAYCFIVISLTVDSFHSYILYTVSELFQLKQLLVETDWVEGIQFHFIGINWSMLLCGLVIWTIARIFKYGAFLQEEYDATV